MIKSLYKRILSEKTRVEIRQHQRKLLSPFYFGNRFHCNCCGKSFRKFLPKGNIKRLNAACPYCGSLERTRLLDLYLQNETQVFHKHLKVLHFAPEPCLYHKLSQLDITYIDADINPALAHYTVDITDIPYPDNYFDLIICSHVLGHVPDEAKAIQELKRVLIPQGTALILTLLHPTLPHTLEKPGLLTAEERLKHYGEADLCRLHGQDFGDRLARQGFVVEKIDYRQHVPAAVAERNRLGDGQREIIFKCSKP